MQFSNSYQPDGFRLYQCLHRQKPVLLVWPALTNLYNDFKVTVLQCTEREQLITGGTSSNWAIYYLSSYHSPVHCAWPCKFNKQRINVVSLFLHISISKKQRGNCSICRAACHSGWTLALPSVTHEIDIKAIQKFWCNYAELEADSNCTISQFIRAKANAMVFKLAARCVKMSRDSGSSVRPKAADCIRGTDRGSTWPWLPHWV